MKKVLKSTSVALLSATLLATVTPALTNTVSATTNSFESKQPEKSPLITSEWFEEDNSVNSKLSAQDVDKVLIINVKEIIVYPLWIKFLNVIYMVL